GTDDPHFNSLGYYLVVHHAGYFYPTIANGHDFYTLYAHLEKQPTFSVGNGVSVGQQLGEVGTTGNESGLSEGDGLVHFEIRLFKDLFHPQSWTSWDLPRPSGVNESNIYIYGDRTDAALLADPDNT